MYATKLAGKHPPGVWAAKDRALTCDRPELPTHRNVPVLQHPVGKRDDYETKR